LLFVPVQELHTFSTTVPRQQRLQNRNSTALSIHLAIALPSASTAVVKVSMRKYSHVISTRCCRKMTRDIFFCGTSTNYSRFWYFLDLLVLSPVSPPDNIFALPTEVFSSRLAIISAVTVGGLFLWPSLRYGTGYQTVREIRPSAETPSSVHWRRFYFQLTCVHSALELSGRCALQIYILTYHWWSFSCRLHMVISTSLDFYLFNFAVCIVCSIGNYVSADVTW